MNDNSILPNHTVYMGRYYHHNIKREEITLLNSKDNIFLFQFEYFTSTIRIEDNVDFSKSKAQYSNNDQQSTTQSSMNENETDNQNLKSDEYTIVESFMDRPNKEKELIIIYMSHFVKGIKLVYQNNVHVDNPKSSFVRYVIFNSKYF